MGLSTSSRTQARHNTRLFHNTGKLTLVIITSSSIVAPGLRTVPSSSTLIILALVVVILLRVPLVATGQLNTFCTTTEPAVGVTGPTLTLMSSRIVFPYAQIIRLGGVPVVLCPSLANEIECINATTARPTIGPGATSPNASHALPQRAIPATTLLRTVPLLYKAHVASR